MGHTPVNPVVSSGNYDQPLPPPIEAFAIRPFLITSVFSALQVIFYTKKQEKSSAENVLIRVLVCGP